jgi:hypothetical protein
MKSLLANSLLLSAAVLGCAGASASPKPDNPVRVYAADASRISKSPGELEGCRLLEMTRPVLEEESDRAWNDPYRRQRNAAEALGGNVMLVFSDVVLQRPSTDCSPRDTSPGCLEFSQTWYKTSFGYYACSPEAAERLDAEARASNAAGPIFSWTFAKRAQPAAAAPPAASPAPAAAAPVSQPASAASENPAAAPAKAAASSPTAANLKSKILAMMEAGVGADLIAAWVGNQAVKPALSAEDVIDWKKSGIEERVIQAALTR